MDYSTFNNKNFFIKKDSTLPELKYVLTQHVMEQYDITKDMLENVAVTFSMVEADTGRYRVANTPANIVINNDRAKYPDEFQYTLTYRFKLPQTKKVGRYEAELVIDFLGETGCGKIKFPVNNVINVIITDSITKTTVV